VSRVVPRVERIDSLADPRVDRYRELPEARLLDAQGLFVAESGRTGSTVVPTNTATRMANPPSMGTRRLPQRSCVGADTAPTLKANHRHR
jgi:hypothetical protein